MLRPKTAFSEKTVKNVHIGKGTVKLRNFQLEVYCFVTDGILIDTGAKTLERDLLPFFAKHDIDKIVITHHHEDHTGNAAFLQENYQLPIYMSDEKIDECRKKAEYPLYRKVFWGKRDPFLAQPIGKTFSSRTFTWDVIKTPGHAIDHIALFNKETGQLFTGDLYCYEKTKVVLPEESISTIITSIKKVLTYDFDEVFCSHAGYIKNGREVLSRKLDYLLELQEKILKLYQEGKSIRQITKTIFLQKFPITIFSFGEWSPANIVKSVIRDCL